MSPETDLRRQALDLHRSISSMTDLFFPPTGGVFLKLQLGRLRELTAGKVNTLGDSDAWGVYAQWHEAVHMVQLATSPYMCLHALRLATLAHHAVRGTVDAPLAQLREDYRAAQVELENKIDGYTPWEIIETHAVTQGLLWTVGGNAEGLFELASRLYRDDPRYIRVLRQVVKEAGSADAIRLLPPLCFIALQFAEPTAAFGPLVERIFAKRLGSTPSEWTPRRLCEWAGIDPARVCKSLRERDTPLRDHWWLQVFGLYFDEFERLTLDERLNVLMGLHGSGTYSLFRPTFTVYSDGEIELSRTMPPSLEEEAKRLWIARTGELLKGLRLLAA